MSAGNGKCPVFSGSLPLPALSPDWPLHESWQGEREEPEGGPEHYPLSAVERVTFVISFHIGSSNGFADWDVGKDFQEEHSGRQLMLPEVRDKVSYHISVTCTTQNHYQRKIGHAKRSQSLTRSLPSF